MRFLFALLLICLVRCSTITPILTRWGKTLDKQHPLPEYPRPQLVRPHWLNLNGPWDYAITPTEDLPKVWDGTIIVPFAPETILSGAARGPNATETLWYHRTFVVPDEWAGMNVILHFGAVDQYCTVWVNENEVGSHSGGYTPFAFDVTPSLARAGANNTIYVAVHDPTQQGIQGYGKQNAKRGGIWYTPTSGIWQTVWIEAVPERHVASLRITPLFDESKVKVDVVPSKGSPAGGSVIVSARGVAAQNGTLDDKGSCVLDMYNFTAWTPDTPFLYDLNVTIGNDTVQSYFGMRKFSKVEKDGFVVLALNNKPLFHNGLLDQGYWSDGMYTPPHDDAMVYDIQTMKRLGYNVLRKHIKIEPMRWYYHCDRIGMMVWQDMVNGGSDYKNTVIQVLPYLGIMLDDTHYSWFGRENADGRNAYEVELRETISALYNCPCIAMWVPFNEGWGQFDSLRIEKLVRSLDSTRLVDHASGWHDQGGGDLLSRHIYFKPVWLKDAGARALAITEFGGYSLEIAGHMVSDKTFGYKYYKNSSELFAAYKKLYEESVIPNIAAHGLSATIYTQVSDVEDEVNGLMTYDREIIKMNEDDLRELNKRVSF